MSSGINDSRELLRRPIDEILVRAEQALERGQRCVERSHKRVRESQFMLRIADEMRASAASASGTE